MPPASYTELKDAITRAYPELSKQLQRIARFALDKPHDLALHTVAALAEAAEVQPSAVIRFANALGYSGFSEMQQVFRGHLVERSSSSYRERIEQLRTRQRNELLGQRLDVPAICGIGLIIAGVLVVNLFSSSVGH